MVREGVGDSARALARNGLDHDMSTKGARELLVSQKLECLPYSTVLSIKCH